MCNDYSETRTVDFSASSRSATDYDTLSVAMQDMSVEATVIDEDTLEVTIEGCDHLIPQVNQELKKALPFNTLYVEPDD